MLLYIGWVIAAFMAGYALANWRRQFKPSLQQRMTQIPVFRGKTYAEILREIKLEPQTVQISPDGHTLRSWRDQDEYSITLEFDGGDVCMGVASESIINHTSLV